MTGSAREKRKRREGPKRTRTEAEREIARRRSVGGRLADTCFSLSVNALTPFDREKFGKIVREWDSIQRSKPSRGSS